MWPALAQRKVVKVLAALAVVAGIAGVAASGMRSAKPVFRMPDGSTMQGPMTGPMTTPMR